MKLVYYSAFLAGLASCVQGLIPIEIKGDRFIRPAVNSSDTGEEFIVIGVDYQPGGSGGFQLNGKSDVLTDADACLRDAYLLQQLGVNTIRVYSVNPWINHDDCMSIFNAVGIYVLLDVNNPFVSLSRTDPGSTYNSGYLNQIFGVIDAFKGYPNVLGFFSGNEVVNDGPSAGVVPQYIRAVQRDMKQYIAKHSDRHIPVGYSAADDLILREAMWDYVQCGDDKDDSKAEFYGLNSYEWCSGTSDWTTSGYDKLNSTFSSSSIPLFLSEYGCNKNTPRTFDEVSQAIYKPDALLATFSGGLVYEYSMEVSNYGLVKLNSDGDAQLVQDYSNLQKQYNSLNLPKIADTDVSASVQNTSCTSSLISGVDSKFQTNFTLPACPDTKLLDKGTGNNNLGHLVPLKAFSTTHKIYKTNGDQITDTNITVVPGSEINGPAGKTTDNGSPAAATTTKKKNSGGNLPIPSVFAGILAIMAAIL